MADPIVDVVVAFAEAIMENPVSASLVTGAIRVFTGYVQLKLTGKTNGFDKKIFAATLTKYLVAVNALTPLASLVGYGNLVPYLTLIGDIGFSAIRKLKNGK